MATFGWKLDRMDRSALLERFLPIWPDVLADHVTLGSDEPGTDRLPSKCSAQVVGQIDDGQGLQALVVAIESTTRRHDGSTFHITWSLDKGRARRAVESNQLLANMGWHALAKAGSIRLIPARLDGDGA